MLAWLWNYFFQGSSTSEKGLCGLAQVQARLWGKAMVERRLDGIAGVGLNRLWATTEVDGRLAGAVSVERRLNGKVEIGCTC